jgi:hypothetical protein
MTRARANPSGATRISPTLTRWADGSRCSPPCGPRRLVEQRQPYIGYTADDINLLHEARWYGEDDVPLGQVFAALATPAFLLCSR